MRARLFIFLALTAAVAPAAEPRNLDLVKADLRDYVQSGEYLRAIGAVAAQADAWLVERAAKRVPGERLAVVFDLDETLLSNWPHIDAMGLGYTPAAWETWVVAAKAPPIEPVRAVYRTARRLGIEIIYITGRRERQRPGTEKNVRAIECGEFVELVMKPDDWKGTAAEFKAAARARVTARGHKIVANVGDQDSDLTGGHAERTFKLPNPFYLSK